MSSCEEIIAKYSKRKKSEMNRTTQINQIPANLLLSSTTKLKSSPVDEILNKYANKKGNTRRRTTSQSERKIQEIVSKYKQNTKIEFARTAPKTNINIENLLEEGSKSPETQLIKAERVNELEISTAQIELVKRMRESTKEEAKEKSPKSSVSNEDLTEEPVKDKESNEFEAIDSLLERVKKLKQSNKAKMQSNPVPKEESPSIPHSVCINQMIGETTKTLFEKRTVKKPKIPRFEEFMTPK